MGQPFSSAAGCPSFLDPFRVRKREGPVKGPPPVSRSHGQRMPACAGPSFGNIGESLTFHQAPSLDGGPGDPMDPMISVMVCAPCRMQ